MRFSPSTALLLATVACAAALASGACQAADPSRWTLYAGQLVANDLPPFAFDAVRGRLDWRDSYFLGGSWLEPVGTPPWLGGFFGSLGMQPVTTELEWIGLKHFSGQHNGELALAYMAHTAYSDWGGLRLRAGGGMGPSLALGRPSAEDGPQDEPDRRSRLQNYIGLELEGRLADAPGTALVLRLHHRSGVYGLVAPQGVGSNFVTLGLRFDWR
ncbi:hypothetical protein GT347_09755 [Xylophilus rhododendri]|uniref:Acyloxyacyl hydrolase n=1 Tax=Xylophilus rhododendri TaxID=2697032 RepID=A0A857J2U1_9BURK|nr:hypothetical protein [Xylophilus rhododendri]QHI98254.1 hypothetical protein GT347_09755 [Xylophilus rhododendri]